MTVRDWDKYTESSPDWAMLKGCFGDGRIEPEDIDGHVERGGVHLILEHKLPPRPGAKLRLKVAQDIGFDAFRRQGNTVVVFWCRSPDGSDITHMQVYKPGGENFPEPKPATLDDLRRECREWFDSCPPPRRRYS